VHVWFPWLLGVIGRRLGFRKMVQRTHRRRLTGAQIHERARSGDKEAIFLYQRLGYYLGIACASLANILNPDIIVLGDTILLLSGNSTPTIRAT